MIIVIKKIIMLIIIIIIKTLFKCQRIFSTGTVVLIGDTVNK